MIQEYLIEDNYYDIIIIFCIQEYCFDVYS